MPRTATIGPAVYQRVNELVSEGKSRTEAFAQVGQERGQRPGTVAANYYRTARSQGAASSGPRSGRSSSKTSRRRRRSGRTTASAGGTGTARSTNQDGDLTALASQIAALTQQLVEQIDERDAKLRELIA